MRGKIKVKFVLTLVFNWKGSDCSIRVLYIMFHFLSPQRSASVVAANSPMLSVPDPLASGGDIKQNKFSRKSIGSSPTKQNSPEGHVPNGKNSYCVVI